jgi:hypothetical protein
MDTESVFPPPQRLTPDRQERLRTVLLDGIQRSPTEPSQAGARRWRTVAVGAAAASAGVLAWVFIGSGALTPAPAWAAVPRPASPATAAKLSSACQAMVAEGRWPIRLGHVEAVLAEQRGASTAVLLVADDGSDAVCVDPRGRTTGPAGGFAGPLVGVVTEDPVADAVFTVDGTPGGPGLGLWTVFGRISAPGVAKVVITLGDGREVTATAGNGHYLAWWPVSGGGGETIRALDSSGHTLASMQLNLTDSAPQPQHSGG